MLWDVEDWGQSSELELKWIGMEYLAGYTVARHIAIELGRCYALGCFYDPPV
jgi:hypothetical protein